MSLDNATLSFLMVEQSLDKILNLVQKQKDKLEIYEKSPNAKPSIVKARKFYLDEVESELFVVWGDVNVIAKGNDSAFERGVLKGSKQERDRMKHSNISTPQHISTFIPKALREL